MSRALRCSGTWSQDGETARCALARGHDGDCDYDEPSRDAPVRVAPTPPAVPSPTPADLAATARTIAANTRTVVNTVRAIDRDVRTIVETASPVVKQLARLFGPRRRR